MVSDDELIAIGVCAALWLAAAVAFAMRRRRVAGTLAILAVAATVGTLALLRVGTGHRA